MEEGAAAPRCAASAEPSRAVPCQVEPCRAVPSRVEPGRAFSTEPRVAAGGAAAGNGVLVVGRIDPSDKLLEPTRDSREALVACRHRTAWCSARGSPAVACRDFHLALL